MNPFKTLLTLLAVTPLAHTQTPVDYVDPTIGNISILLVPTRPTVGLPNSMIRVYPVREDATDDQIQSFPLTISSHRQLELFSLIPGTGAPAAYDQEQTTPYYYSTRFDDTLTRLEFTATERAGYFRFTFPGGNAQLTLANRIAGDLRLRNPQTIEGEERFDKMAAYVYGEFSAPVTATSERLKDGQQLTLSGQSRTLEFRYAISFISIDQAKQNLAHEIPTWGFDRVKEAAKARWNQTLGRIEVQGGTEAQRRIFYTALYRCSERMIDITEDGRYYSAYDHQVHTDPRPFYVDNWLWDTYRALEPLQTLLHPSMEADKIQSYVRMYQQAGVMPTFSQVTGPFAAMNGNHAAPWFADAWFKGVRNFDLPTAYEGIRKRSLEVTMVPWSLGPRGPLDEFYTAHGFMPALRPGEKETVPGINPGERRQPVPVTFENSLDDWNIAQLARVLNKPGDEKLFLAHAANYRNLFRVEKGLAWPKDSDGNWIEIDPKFDGGQGVRDFYDENNAYTYTWDVAHDIAGLATLMGGTEKAQANLDQLFREPLGRPRYHFQDRLPDSTAMMGQFSMGNEPAFAIPYLFNYFGAPWKTQKRVRALLEDFFPASLQGIPGDEDGGGMSAFVVFSMMGFYPVTAGVPIYDIGSPVFDRVTLHLENGKNLTILAHGTSRDRKYVQSIRLNGQPLDRVWFRHSDIANGGTLDLTMSDTPNKTLGADPATFPPSSLTTKPEQFTK